MPAITKNAIVQMFNRRFVDIQAELPELSAAGYSYILVSPPQRSHPSEEWWGRYQPVDFTIIDGPLGTGNDLRTLCAVAADHGIRVLVDAVLNHMANHGDYVQRAADGRLLSIQFPRYSRQDFHDPGCNGDICTWLGGLPDLRTESRHVRDEARAYVRRLVDEFGVAGFRFDAARHVEPGFFTYILSRTNGLFCFGEFVVNHPDAVSQDYLQVMDAYDFPLASTLRQAFGWGGDLRLLTSPAQYGRAFTGVSAVTFVRHHDIVHHPDWFTEYAMSSEIDRRLAYAFILGRREGTPFVYLDDRFEPTIRAGLRFHNLALGKDEYSVVAEQSQLVLRRGDDQLCAINKSGESWQLPENPGLRDGPYVECVGGGQCQVQQGRLTGFTLAPSSAAFLIPQGAAGGASGGNA